MILLEYHNRILEETLTQKLTSEKQESIDVTFADFDGILFHVSTPNSKTEVLVSISMKCFGDLQKYGATEYLKNVYGEMLADTPEKGYEATLKFQAEPLPADIPAFVSKIALFKRHCLAAPFHKAFSEFESKVEKGTFMTVSYRDLENIYIQAFPDRVVVIFSTIFKDPTDVIVGKVFLQEFVDARKLPGLQNSPQVLYNKDLPMELKAANVAPVDNVSYVTFVLFPRHFTKERKEATVSMIQTFRDYLHYHIKCSKAYLHQRMRAKVSEFLKVLNRAKPEVAVEKKTASGRTFKKL